MARTRNQDDWRWRKSTVSGSAGSCVEVAFPDGDGVWVRNSRDPDGAILRFTRQEWSAFLAGVRLGEFDD